MKTKNNILKNSKIKTQHKNALNKVQSSTKKYKYNQ